METYRIKTMIEQSVLSLGQRLKSGHLELSKTYTEDNFAQDFGTLLQLYGKIISMDVVDSSYIIKTIQQPIPANDFVPHTRTSDFCHCDIWNTWFYCKTCCPDGEHDFCSDCIAENRQCMDYQNIEWLCHHPIQACFQDLQHFSEIYNSSPLISHLPSFSKVPEYSSLR
ncbi:hypothetical protein DSO57_1010558 [Entomophthora muscae]|uniref:Uncharacterized protein n=1 Tax=Entomophthora muscae TaxID=34485 RepID=A0ACC2SW61_9FUNG|nr:hypothetical protein DSO57_1010558 [Entomophthora muscae]